MSDIRITEKNTIKNWFLTKMKPTQIQFWAWMDSYWHKNEKLPLSSVDGLSDVIDGKASNTHTHKEYATNDSKSLTAENIAEWKNALGVGDKNIKDENISLTSPYPSMGLNESSHQKDFNDVVSRRLDSGDLGKNMANTDLFLSEPRKHTGQQMELAMPMVYSSAQQMFPRLPEKKADVTYNRFGVFDSVGNLSSTDNIYYALLNNYKNMTPVQKVALMKEMNGQYSNGQITTAMILMPIIAIGDNRAGVSKVDIYGTNLNIDPSFSYVRIKEEGNLSRYEDCDFELVNSNNLTVFINNSFLEVDKTYVFEIKHGIQIHTTVINLQVVTRLTDYDLSTITYSITEKVGVLNDGTPYKGTAWNKATIDNTGLILQQTVGEELNTLAPIELRSAPLVKVKTNTLFDYNQSFIVIIDFNWGYETGDFEFPKQFDLMGVAKHVNYPENDATNNIVAGIGTGWGNGGKNNYGRQSGIIGGGLIPKAGAGQAIIIKKDGVLTTVLFMNGTVIRYAANATLTTGYSIEFLFVGRYLRPKQVGEYRISSIQTF